MAGETTLDYVEQDPAVSSQEIDALIVRQPRPLTLKHAVIISDLSEERDGPTAIAFANVRHLLSKNIKVTYVCGDGGESPALQALGVRIVPVRGTELAKANRAKAALNGLYNADAARSLNKLISEIDDETTLYHVHSWSKILSPSIFTSLRRVLPRVVLSAHDYFLSCPNGGYFNFPKKTPCPLTPLSPACLGTNCDRRSAVHKMWRLARDMERRFFMQLSSADVTVLAVHDGMKPLLERGGVAPDAIRVLRNPVQPWSKTRVAAERNKKFLFVGRLEHDKAPDLLAAAARTAGVQLQLVGDGPLRATLAEKYPEVDFQGWRTRAEIAELARDARVLVLPTASRETFGLAAFEALTSGIPVIISKFAATYDEVTANGLGLGLDPYDTATFVDALRDMAADDAGIAAKSEAAWRLRTRLTLSSVQWGEMLMSYYEDRLERR